ncbi:MAG: hypothetical protein ACE5GG_04125 [Candidatus Omnitrophota bacterium]
MLLNDEKNITGQRYLILGIFVALGLAMVTAAYFVFGPLVREIWDVTVKIRTGREIVFDERAYQREHDKMEARIAGIKKKIARGKERLFWDEGIGVFLEKLTYIARQLSVDFISIKPRTKLEALGLDGRKVEKKDKSDNIMFRSSIDITMKIGYRELIAFLSRLERSDKFFMLDELDIEKSNDDIYKHNVKMVLSIFSAD